MRASLRISSGTLSSKEYYDIIVKDDELGIEYVLQTSDSWYPRIPEYEGYDVNTYSEEALMHIVRRLNDED